MDEKIRKSLIESIAIAKSQVEKGKIKTQIVTDLYNKDKPEAEKLNSSYVGKYLCELGFEKTLCGVERHGGFIYNEEKVIELVKSLNLVEVVPKPEVKDVEKLGTVEKKVEKVGAISVSSQPSNVILVKFFTKLICKCNTCEEPADHALFLSNGKIMVRCTTCFANLKKERVDIEWREAEGAEIVQ